MVSEKPPRRSKVEKDPVTIDLTPEESRVVETDAVAEPVRSNDSDEPTGAAGSTLGALSEMTTDSPLKSDDSPTPDPAEKPARDGKAEQAESESATASDQPQFDDEITPSNPDDTQSAASNAAALHAAARRKQTNPATSTLVAAGIFGGIIALLLAGAMQYAGVLPGASSSSANDTSAISDEIEALRQEIRALGAQPARGDSGLAARVQALEANSASGGGSNELSGRLSSIEKQIGEIKSATAATAANDADLSRRLQQAETKMNDRGPEQQVARAIAAAALKAAIDRGGAFEPELQTYEGLAANDPAIAGLKPFAAKGVPSRAELQREFPRVADKMIEAAAVPDPDQGIAGRLLSSAMSVVKVRRVGEVEGDTAEAIVARMEQSLQNGDLAGALREWQTLPEPAKAASGDFTQKIDARMKVEDLVGGTLSRALAGTQG